MIATSLGRLLTTVFAVLLITSCASERKPINKVQTDAMSKEFFVGKNLSDSADDPAFYWRNFVVDGSEAQSMIGIGSWSGVDRIRWEITEKMLFARRAYQVSPGADDKGLPDGEPNGDLVAAYPIVSHFDIKRAYNPSTGEELNVIEENTTDRVWNERGFFRVDWSVNLVDTPLWYDMFVGKMFGDIRVTPLTHYVNDPTHEDAPHFVPEAGYFDITSKFYVEPAGYLWSGIRVPGCTDTGYYTASATESCDPQQATVRSSYWRVDQLDPDEDFEPFENSRASLEIIGNPGGLGDSSSLGIVTPPHISWDPQYGYTDANLRRFMHIHNVWVQSHQTRGSCTSDADCGGSACLASGVCAVQCSYDGRRDSDNNGTDDQCENAATGYTGSQGSQCSARNRCTIPYRDRVIKPVGFWMNKETPADLTDAVDADGKFVSRGPTEDLVYTWNQVLKQSVAKAREVECRRTGGDRAACHEQFFDAGIDMVSFGGWGIEKVKAPEDVLVACHNPVRSYDNKLCGEPGYSARVGDLRHNFLFYWPHASRAPWGGIANWNADPVTGQIIGASATTMGRSATMSAAINRDLIMVANGELTVSDITNGTPASLYERQMQNGYRPPTYSKAEIDKRVRSIDALNVMRQVAPTVSSSSSGTEQLVRHFESLHNRKVDNGLSPAHLRVQATMDALRGSEYEAALVDGNRLVDGLGLSPDTQISDGLLDLASPLRGQDPAQLQTQLNQVFKSAEARGVCYFDSLIGGVGNYDVRGVAKYFFLTKYSDAVVGKILASEGVTAPSAAALSSRRAELIYHDLWIQTYKGIQLHEMGHALGLLHNFASSYDSTNYNPQYWQLRTQEGRAAGSCAGEPRSGNTFPAATDTCMGPRYLDPETDDELGQGDESRPGINYFGHTTTMEYQNERFFETVGLGQYDMHAMNVLYGRVLQTLDADRGDGLSRAEQAPIGSKNYTQLVDVDLVGPSSLHYTETARQMKLFDPSRCREATQEEKDHAEWRIVHGKVCAPPPKDYGHWDDFEHDYALPEYPAYFTTKLRVRPDAGSAGGNVRWPYRWGVTNNAYVHTNPSDAGADIYEVTMETIRKFDYAYPFRYFRRQSRDGLEWAAASRTIDTFHQRLHSYHWGIAYDTAFRRAYYTPEEFEQAANSDDDWRPALVAETAMFDAFSRALMIPQIGTYGPTYTPIDSSRPLHYASNEGLQLFDVDASNGRYIYFSVNDGPFGGGSWEYWNWVNWVGFSIEKAVAAQSLIDTRPALTIVSNDAALDPRRFSVSFRSVMPQAVDRLIGGLLAGDFETIAPYVASTDLGIDNAVPPVRTLNLYSTSEPPSRPAGALLLYPNVGYTHQLYTLMWAFVFAQNDIDTTLESKLRIWIDGAIGQVNIPEEQQVRFYNPESGLTYIGRKFGADEIDGKIVDKGIASRMIARANAYLTAIYEVQVDTAGEPILDAFGQPQLQLDADGNAIQKDEFYLYEFRQFTGLLDAAVNFNSVLNAQQ